jgi:hypothetical protein
VSQTQLWVYYFILKKLHLVNKIIYSKLCLIHSIYSYNLVTELIEHKFISQIVSLSFGQEVLFRPFRDTEVCYHARKRPLLTFPCAIRTHTSQKPRNKSWSLSFPMHEWAFEGECGCTRLKKVSYTSLCLSSPLLTSQQAFMLSRFVLNNLSQTSRVAS